MALALLATIGFGPAPVSADDTGGLKFIGRLALPPEASDIVSGTSLRVVRVDPIGRRLFMAYPKKGSLETYIREYDLRPRIPRFVREGLLGTNEEISWGQPMSPNIVAFDSRRNRLLILSNSGAPAGCSGDPTCGSTLPAPVKVFVFDLKTFKRVGAPFNVQATIPGMLAAGITYSPEDDRIYLAGELQPGGVVAPYLVGNEDITVPRRPPSIIAALDPETGARIWARVIPECDTLLAHQQVQLLIRRSAAKPVLYFACVRMSVWPGTSALVRLWIDPKGAQVDAVNFPVEVFPISGAYVRGDGLAGVAEFDPVSERFFLQSQATRTPGAWVFDGALSAWVGFITAPDNFNTWGGVQPQTGRYYMGGDNNPSYIVISDARQTPVPQGTIVKLRGQLYNPIYVDAPTQRLFLNLAPGGGQKREWLVYEDRVPAEQPDPGPDYDGLTDDVAESAKTHSAFSGDVNGFAARVSLVGGTSGVLSVCQGASSTSGRCDPTDPDYDFADSFPQRAPPPFSGATRELFLARTQSLDMRNVGVSADAQSTAVDPTTDGEYKERLQEEISRTAGEDQESADRPINDALKWPWPQAFCIDSAGESASDTQPGQGGNSTVSCDLEKGTADAFSSFSGFTSDAPQADVSIASGSFDAHVLKDAKLGTVTDSIAVARGVRIAIPQIGSLTIGHVVATATTHAHGRSGTAAVEWKRTIDHVVVRNAAGDVVFKCADADQCDPRAVVDAVNRTLQVRLKIRFPTPQLVKTPKGAFASVRESDSDFLIGLTTNEDSSRSVPAVELVLYNDTSEKSRLVVQLAAIQSSSIYGISTLPPDVLGGGLAPFPPSGPLLPPVEPPFPTFNPPAGGSPGQGIGTRLVRTGLFLIRSPKEALLVGLTILLMAGALAAAWRRRTLLHSLGEIE